jgi:hypothetical protein
MLSIGGVAGAGHSFNDLLEQGAGAARVVQMMPIDIHQARAQKGRVVRRPLALQCFFKCPGGGSGVGEMFARNPRDLTVGHGIIRFAFQHPAVFLDGLSVVAPGQGRPSFSVRIVRGLFIGLEKEVPNGIANSRHDHKDKKNASAPADEDDRAEEQHHLARIDIRLLIDRAYFVKKNQCEPSEPEEKEDTGEKAHATEGSINGASRV